MTMTVVWFSSTTMTRKGSISQITVAKTPERDAPGDAWMVWRCGADHDEARRLVSVRPEEFEPEADLVEALSPFRAAFARAREEGMAVVESQRPDGPELQRVTSDEEHAGRSEPPAGRFEVRIEKRRGKRSTATKHWTDLGAEGWELAAVVGKEAFFRRIRYQP